VGSNVAKKHDKIHERWERKERQRQEDREQGRGRRIKVRDQYGDEVEYEEARDMAGEWWKDWGSEEEALAALRSSPSALDRLRELAGSRGPLTDNERRQAMVDNSRGMTTTNAQVVAMQRKIAALEARERNLMNSIQARHVELSEIEGALTNVTQALKHPVNPKDVVRVVRIVEYIGQRDVVESVVAKSIQGEKYALVKDAGQTVGGIMIRVATLGKYPDILSDAVTREAEERGEPEDPDTYGYNKSYDGDADDYGATPAVQSYRSNRVPGFYYGIHGIDPAAEGKDQTALTSQMVGRSDRLRNL
jgi:hypothetical protein